MAPLNKFDNRILVCVVVLLQLMGATQAIGVNYGTKGDNLPPPQQVAEFLRTKTIIDRVKLFDSNPDIIRAFANSGIAVSISVANDYIPTMAQQGGAQQWLAANVAPFVPATNINRILVGNEVLQWGPQQAIDSLVAAMRSLRQALDAAGLQNIQVSTPHSLGILLESSPPSAGKFRPGWDTGVLAPILQFHRDTKSAFMVNPYPYFGANPENYQFCIFQSQQGMVDPVTKLTYTNRYDSLLDATLFAMKLLGYADVEIAVGETGWPTVAEGLPFVTVDTAQSYNGNVVKKSLAGFGTPIMPGRKFEVYLFALFTEDLKPGPLAERNFGLFRPDFSPVYDAGLLRTGGGGAQVQPLPQPQQQTQQPVVTQSGQWCLAKLGIPDDQLQKNVDYVCSQGIDCGPIQSGAACFEPNDLLHHANFAMNSWYQAKGHLPANCDFSGTGLVVTVDPSYGTCRYHVAA